MTFAKLLRTSLIALALHTTSATAAVVTDNIEFAAAGFGPDAPYDPISGRVSVTFDNATDITNSTIGLTASISIPVTGAIGFDYIARADQIQVGGLLNGVIGLRGNTSDLILSIINASTAPQWGALLYSTLRADAIYAAFNSSVVGTSIAEPTSLVVVAAGLVSLVFARRTPQASV